MIQAATDLLVNGRPAVRTRSPAPHAVDDVSPLTCINSRKRGSPMVLATPARTKIPTEIPQPARGKPARPAVRTQAGSRVLASGTGRAATRGGGEVIELEYGITVYP